MEKKYNIGIDIGGTNTVFGLVEKTGNIIKKGSISTKGFESINQFIIALKKEMEKSFPESFWSNIEKIGIGAPNGNYYTGNIEFAPNLEWKGVLPLKNLFESYFNIPTIVSNDANAAAMGEHQYGNAKGMHDFIMITLGTGVGSGFYSNGKIIYGHDGFAGELGHVIAVREGRSCGCGRKGCLETYTSATGIVKTAHDFLKENPNSILYEVENITAKEIFIAAEKNDELAKSIFDYTGKILGQTLADAVAITSPEAIILFGGLAQAGKYIFEPTQKYMEENLLSIYKNKVKILPSALSESDVAILGASALI
ncbi:MAG: ROK family protein [Chitinophagaceae bacterium]